MKPLLDKDTQTIDPESLELLDLLIHDTVKGLQQKSYKPRIQDALKAIQLRGKVAKASEVERSETRRGEKIFWDMIDEIREEELPKMYPQTPSLEDQIQDTVLGLKSQVKNGVLPVKIITDTFNESRSEESRLTYRRVGQLLSTMGFRKARTHTGSFVVLWDDNLLFQSTPANAERNENQTPVVGRAVSPAGGGRNCPTIGCGTSEKQSFPAGRAPGPALGLSKDLPCCPAINPEKNEKPRPAHPASPACPVSPAVSGFR